MSAKLSDCNIHVGKSVVEAAYAVKTELLMMVIQMNFTLLLLLKSVKGR